MRAKVFFQAKGQRAAELGVLTPTLMRNIAHLPTYAKMEVCYAYHMQRLPKRRQIDEAA